MKPGGPVKPERGPVKMLKRGTREARAPREARGPEKNNTHI
jgi:hypothetical protein